MQAFYQVGAFAPHDPEDKQGAQRKYDETLLAVESAFNDFKTLIASGKFEYVVIEWVGPGEEANDEAASTEAL